MVCSLPTSSHSVNEHFSLQTRMSEVSLLCKSGAKMKVTSSLQTRQDQFYGKTQTSSLSALLLEQYAHGGVHTGSQTSLHSPASLLSPFLPAPGDEV